MIKLKKQPKRYISLPEKLKILEFINEKKPFETWEIKYSAFQMQELRNFLFDYIQQYNQNIIKKEFDLSSVKEKMVPIQKYFHNQDCRESLDACEHETCLGSEPNCFSKKVKGQIIVIIDEIYKLS